MVEPTKPRQRARKGGEENLSSVALDAVTPTEDNIREVLTRVEDVFKGLGTDAFPGTLIPAGSKNNAREAAEYVLAEKLAKLAEERKKNAFEAAEKVGVFGDPETYVQGDTVMVFSDPNFSINVKMGKPSKMVKKELVQKAAEEYLGKKAGEFMEACMGDRAATKQIIVSMK